MSSFIESEAVVSRSRSSRSRAFVFTVNNYSAADQDTLRLLGENVKYLVFGREVGASGTPHLQGYVYFKNAATFEQCKKKLPKGCHIEVAKGDAESNLEYCSKDGDFEEFGDLPKSSKRKGEEEADRWTVARRAAEQGQFADVPDKMYIQYVRNFKQIHVDFKMNKELNTLDVIENHWFWGASGTGKSREARSRFPEAYYKMKNKWWDNYTHEEVVIIDDIDPSHETKFGAMLKEWADHYPFRAEVKGSSIMIRPKILVVTSQYEIHSIFRDPETVAALKRRFKITHFRSLNGTT